MESIEIKDKADLIGVIAAHMVFEVFEKYSIETMPEEAFSTFVFGLIDHYFRLNDKGMREFCEFVTRVLEIGSKTLAEERKGNA